MMYDLEAGQERGVCEDGEVIQQRLNGTTMITTMMMMSTMIMLYINSE